MGVELSKPGTWLDGDLANMHTIISNAEKAAEIGNDTTTQLERMGAVKIARKMRENKASVDLDSLAEFKKVFQYRVQQERPNVETILGSDTDSESVRTRIEFMLRYGYPQAEVAEQYSKLQGN